MQAYDALNFLGSIPWRINKQALEVLSSAWERGGNIGGLIPRSIPPAPTRTRLNMILRRQPFNMITQVCPIQAH